jgi:GSH-dependent disulfide-bond oxidoreductase
MIDLYAAGTSNGMRARMALEETGLAYQLHPIALEKGENRTAQFLALNPDGQIPVLVDREGPGGKPLTLSQSTAILIYCAEKSGKLMPRDGAARAAMWEALASASTDITPTMGALFAVARAKEPYVPSVELFKARVRQYLQVWDDRLASRRYAAGDELTIADVSLYAGYARIRATNPETCEGLAHLRRWGEELAARPALQRAVRF